MKLKRYSKCLAAIALILAAALLYGCSASLITPPPLQIAGDTSVIAYIRASNSQKALDWVTYRLQNVAATLAAQEGEVASINALAGTRCETSPLVVYLLQELAALYAGGATGLTLVKPAPLDYLLEEEIAADLNAIEIDPAGYVGVSTGTMLDLTQVYVGAALDVAMAELVDRRVNSAMLAAEGVCICSSAPETGKKWTYIVPATQDEQLSPMQIQLTDAAAATHSEVGGEIVSATVIGKSAMVAQALAVTLTKLPLQEAFALLEQHGAYGALIDAQGIIHHSKQLNGQIEVTQVEGYTLRQKS